MADEGTLGLARAQEQAPEDISKAELQHRMDEARDSISQTVTQIKDTVVQQYEAVKETINETLDWREQFKKRPVAWSVGAAGGGFVVGYAIAAMVKGSSSGERRYYEPSESHGTGPAIRQVAQSGPGSSNRDRQADRQREDVKSGPGLLERFQHTDAYGHLRKEAASVGNRFVGELSQTAQEVVLPAAVSWLRQWLEGLVPKTNKTPARVKEGQ